MYTLLSLADNKAHIFLCPLIIPAVKQSPLLTSWKTLQNLKITQKQSGCVECHKSHDSKCLGKAISIWAGQKRPLWGREIWTKMCWIKKKNQTWERQGNSYPKRKEEYIQRSLGGKEIAIFQELRENLWSPRKRKVHEMNLESQEGLVHATHNRLHRGVLLWSHYTEYDILRSKYLEKSTAAAVWETDVESIR